MGKWVNPLVPGVQNIKKIRQFVIGCLTNSLSSTDFEFFRLKK